MLVFVINRKAILCRRICILLVRQDLRQRSVSISGTKVKIEVIVSKKL